MRTYRILPNLLLAVGCLLLVSATFAAFPTFGSEPVAFTVAPSLFQINLSPGENWKSNLIISNNGSADLTFYASAINFSKNLTPILNENPEIYGRSLANWIKFPEKNITVPRKQSALLPFSLELPKDAQPDIHTAAILVGTQPLNQKTKELKSAGFISSVLSVRVGGAVKVGGSIKSFFADSKLYQAPEIKFSLTFENTGNINLQPSGEIKIYNQRGEEKGSIVLNPDELNILPGKNREFILKWSGEQKENRFGRYKAVASLIFGMPAQDVTKEVYFWILPITTILGIAGIIFLLPLFLFFAAKTIRAYTHKLIEGEFHYLQTRQNSQSTSTSSVWRPFTFMIAISLVAVAGGLGARYFVELRNSELAEISNPNSRQPIASMIHKSYFISPSGNRDHFKEVEILRDEKSRLTFPEFFYRILPFFDRSFLGRTFQDDFTAFQYHDINGFWPGYVAKINNRQAFMAVIAPILENYASRFYASPEILGDFKDGFVAGAKTRYAVGSQPGSAFNYGLFNDYLVVSTSFDEFKLALKALGITLSEAKK